MSARRQKTLFSGSDYAYPSSKLEPVYFKITTYELLRSTRKNAVVIGVLSPLWIQVSSPCRENTSLVSPWWLLCGFPCRFLPTVFKIVYVYIGLYASSSYTLLIYDYFL